MARVAPRFLALAATSAALALAWALPAAAHAAAPADQRFAVGSPAMVEAQGIARAYWNAQACGGAVDIRWTDMPATTNAVSTWSNPTSAYGNPGQNQDCQIAINRDIDFDWAYFCTVMVHEYGHLNGRPHSEDPNDVMAAIYNGPIAACTQAPDPTAAPPAAAPPAAPSAPTATAASRSINHSAKPRTHRRARKHASRHHRRHVRRHLHRVHH